MKRYGRDVGEVGNDTRIDPRVKLFQIVLFGAMMFLLHTDTGIGLYVAVLAGSLVVLGQPICGLKLLGYYVVLSLLHGLVIGVAQGGGLLMAVALILFLLRKFSLILGVYYLFTRAMCVGEFLNALNVLRVPRNIVIPLAVTLRFFPTIGQEMVTIRDALRLRGRPLTIISIGRAPMEMLEYVFVPLMMRCVRIADELSASAVTRGIENPQPHTALYTLRFRWTDALYLAVLVGASAALIVYEALLI